MNYNVSSSMSNTSFSHTTQRTSSTSGSKPVVTHQSTHSTGRKHVNHRAAASPTSHWQNSKGASKSASYRFAEGRKRDVAKSPPSTTVYPRATGSSKGSGKYDVLIQEAAAEFGVSPVTLSKMMGVESKGKPGAISPKNAGGLMQLMPKTAAMLGVKNRFDPKESIRGGAKYLGQMLAEFNGNERLAVAAYNAGPGAVRKYNGIPPYKETQNYVKKILG